MKKRLFWIILLQSISVMALAQSGTYDVRKVRWWMSPQQVITSEAVQPAQRSSEKLVFKYVQIGDDHADLVYEFHSNKLVRLTYAFLEQNGDYGAYKSVDEKISERYGTAADTRENWRTTKRTYGQIVDYSAAIKNGELRLLTQWVSKRTDIVHLMTDEAHGLSYSSRLEPKPASEKSKDF